MRIVAVDDEVHMLEQFKWECERYDNVIIEGLFDDPAEALAYLNDHEVDVVFLDVEMPILDGLSLGREIRKRYPKIILIFITAYDSYAVPAVHLKSDYYLIKPYSSADIDDVMENIRLLTGRLKKRVFIQCFGKFQVFVNEKPMVFRSRKAKELLAVLVDKKGAIVSSEEAFNLIWEDKIYNNYTGSAYRKTLVKLADTLKENKCEEILIRTPKGCAINRSAIECDYYKYLEGENGIFYNEYMINYSWGEYTLANLVMRNA